MDTNSDNPAWTVAVRGGVRIEALDAWSRAVAIAVLPELCLPGGDRSPAEGTDLSVVFVPSAARAVREALRAGVDPTHARSTWISAIESLLAARQNNPEGSLLFDAEEARDSVSSVRETVSARLGMTLTTPIASLAEGDENDALLALVGQQIRHDPVLVELQDQLLAMCQPVFADDASLRSHAAPQPDVWQAIGAMVRSADEGRQALSRQEETLTGLLRFRDEALVRVQGLISQVDELADERDALSARLASADARLQDLEAAHQSTEAVRRRLEHDSLRFAQALERSELALHDEAARSKALQSALEEARTLIATAQDQTRESAQRVAELEGELGLTRAVVAEMEADLKVTRDRFAGQQTQWTQQVVALECAVDAAREGHAALSARLAAAVDDAHRLQQSLEQAEEDGRLARAEAGKIQEALEAARAAAATEAQLARLQLDQVLEEVEQLAHARERLQEQWATSLERVAALEALLETQATDAEAAQDARERPLRDALSLSQLQLAQAQEELREAMGDQDARLAGVQRQYERTSDQLRDALGVLGQRARAHPGVVGASAAFVGLDVLHEHDEPPHRGLTVALQPDDPSQPELFVRLVDHQGHAGLVFFTGNDGQAPLTQWRRSGTEDGHDYMILLPDERGPSDPFRPMASRDWRLVREVTLHLVRALPDEFVARWQPTAVRVLRALDALPPQMRYAALEVPEGESGRVLRFSDVIHGTREWPSLEMRLTPQGELAWALPAGGLPPFAGWPIDTEGRPARLLVLPLSDAASAQAWLEQLGPLDREFQTAALAALDTLVDHPTAGSELRSALRQAHDTLRQARKRARVRRVVRRLLGRRP